MYFDYFRYTNDDNPFGDSSLTSTFRWDKKLKQAGMDKLSERDLNKIHRLKQEEQRQELEKVKQRRLEREREREERSQLMELEDRKRENDKFASWQKDEDKFHLQQARLRSQIRISDGRFGHLHNCVFCVLFYNTDTYRCPCFFVIMD